ncbi:MAG: VWA domain-containing protein [Betaproteobacteria bacterium]|uniref:nitric oxide reductase activation protein NorD n=1 Tax=Thiomonas TaxID=32012 RepID=UPI002391CB6E|nr:MULTISPECIES: VWA domain-containing protein [Thiomonas]MDE2174319.1 VWA domain-containing protein [Betaproteobacteria bacterium]HML81601.1 VWA domain-containing protein [Thiomonas arsenitoxydans]
MVSDALMDDSIRATWARLDTRFPLVEAIFPACMADAQSALTPDGLSAFLEAGRIIGKLGRGAEPLLAFLEAWPSTARAVGEDLLAPVMAVVQGLQKSPNGRAITPFLQTLAPVAQRLQAGEQLQHYLDLTLDLMARTTRSIHGFHTTYPSPGLPDFFNQAPTLLAQLDIGGLQRWVDYGVRNYATHPERQKDYFSLQSADARAVLQRERHGTLLVDVERHLDLYLRALWRDSDLLIPYSTAFDELRKPVPYYDPLGIRLPDVQDDAFGVSGLDRYRAMLAHMVGHRRWSTPQIADNWSPFQRMAVEFFEDCRVETLLIREYAGLRRLFLALHPRPVEDACNPETTSCLRHRLAMLSRALLDPEHGYRDADLNTFVARFHALMAQGTSSTRDIAVLALAYVAKTRRQSDQFAKVHFENTVIDYRDDNRHLWRFIEQGDEEERFDETRRNDAQDDLPRLPPRHYPEWDYHSQTYRPDWVSVYEGLHPSAQAGDIDRLLQKHAPLAKRLQRLLELLKPQDKVRIRYQEEGSELDLDVAIRSLIDFKAGSNPDPRINLSHRTNGRDIAVTLLLDLSASLNDKVKGSEQTILELSQEAVSLLAWAIERLGDPLAIAGFQSNTRHEVRYLHIKGFGEPWGDEVKARLAAMQANYSTRMGAALRHAAQSLRARKSDKKLLLVLTDGEPADIDVQDERLLIEDARQAVRELERDGLFTYCISLDPRADAYVSDIFGRRYTVIDNIERLPERLPEVFLALTK